MLMKKLLLIALVLLTLGGCATTRLGGYDNQWYVVGVNDPIEVQAMRHVGERDTWFIRIVNFSDVDYDVLVGWRTIDYQNNTIPGWTRVRARQFQNLGYFQHMKWELDGVELLLEDAVIKVESVEIEEVKE